MFSLILSKDAQLWKQIDICYSGLNMECSNWPMCLNNRSPAVDADLRRRFWIWGLGGWVFWLCSGPGSLLPSLLKCEGSQSLDSAATETDPFAIQSPKAWSLPLTPWVASVSHFWYRFRLIGKVDKIEIHIGNKVLAMISLTIKDLQNSEICLWEECGRIWSCWLWNPHQAIIRVW